MKLKEKKKKFDVEFLGGFAGIVLIICAVMAFLDFENAPSFFGGVIAMGAVLNGLLAWMKLRDKNYLVGMLLVIVTLALIALFIMQILIYGEVVGS